MPHGAKLTALLTTTLPPVALVTALGVWFGWVLTNARADYLGLDDSVLRFSTNDYLMRSPDAAFVPLTVALIFWLMLLGVHQAVSWAIAHRWRPLLVVALLGVAVGVVLDGFGIWSLFRPLPVRVHYLVPSALLGLGVLISAYGLWTVRAVVQRRAGLPTRKANNFERLAWTVVALIVILSLFWTASVYARALGRGRAEELITNLNQLPAVTIFSKHDLAIHAPGVTTTTGGGSATVYPYRYSGFRLLVRSNERYFLVTDEWTRTSGVAFVIPDSSDVRFEFSPGGRR